MFDPNNPSSGRDDDNDLHKKMSRAPGAIMRQSVIFVTFIGVLIGFLLTIAVSPPVDMAFSLLFALLIAIFSATVASIMFIMPSIFYHIPSHLINLKIFASLSQKFLLYGIIASNVTLYFCLEISLSALLSQETALLVAAAPFALGYSMFLAQYTKMKRRAKDEDE
jgi:hypothetical protein